MFQNTLTKEKELVNFFLFQQKNPPLKKPELSVESGLSHTQHKVSARSGHRGLLAVGHDAHEAAESFRSEREEVEKNVVGSREFVSASRSSEREEAGSFRNAFNHFQSLAKRPSQNPYLPIGTRSSIKWFNWELIHFAKWERFCHKDTRTTNILEFAHGLYDKNNLPFDYSISKRMAYQVANYYNNNPKKRARAQWQRTTSVNAKLRQEAGKRNYRARNYLRDQTIVELLSQGLSLRQIVNHTDVYTTLAGGRTKKLSFSGIRKIINVNTIKKPLSK